MGCWQVPLPGEKGCKPAQLALVWCGQHPGITSPIIGPRTMEQLGDSLGALHLRITGQDPRARLDKAATPGRATVLYYEANFGPHDFAW